MFVLYGRVRSSSLGGSLYLLSAQLDGQTSMLVSIMLRLGDVIPPTGQVIFSYYHVVLSQEANMGIDLFRTRVVSEVGGLSARLTASVLDMWSIIYVQQIWGMNRVRVGAGGWGGGVLDPLTI